MPLYNPSRPLLSAHPAHYALTAFLFLVCTVLYYRQQSYPSISKASFATAGSAKDLTLSERLQRSEEIFQRSRAGRKELTDAFGPDPQSFPFTSNPNGPWPAMTVYDFLYPAFNCPFEMERLGATGDGGKWVCGVSQLARRKTGVIYSFGINYESSFEEAMLSRTNFEVWGYDFSVTHFGDQISEHHKHRAHFQPWGLDGRDNHDGKPPMYTLESLMALNGHKFIDILKIDIETFEFAVMEDILKNYQNKPLPFGQLLIEIHAYEDRFPNSMKLVNWFSALENAGLRPFMFEPNLVYANYNRNGPPHLCEYSFMNVRGHHTLISG